LIDNFLLFTDMYFCISSGQSTSSRWERKK